MTEPFERDCQDAGDPSSRTNATWAGWHRVKGRWTWRNDEERHGEWVTLLRQLSHRRWQAFSWLSARALLDSVNDKVAKLVGDVVDPRRQRWVAAQRVAGHTPDEALRVDGRSFLIVGDPGEIDASQFAVIPPLLGIHEKHGSDFLVVLSDVIYPAGDINDYGSGFYEAFERYDKPIYAVPGNHDWYDGLNGFMWHFCGAEALPPTEYRSSSYSAGERAAKLLWRSSSRPKRDDLQFHRSPWGEAWSPRQPGPYWAMDLGSAVRLIAIDTGITGGLDREQGAWLLRMAAGPKPKVLLTGKPLWVNGEHHPGKIAWGEHKPPHARMLTVDDVVRERSHNFRAVIGGDVHNYQRLTVDVDDAKGRRQIEYVVTGGGGAYMSDVLGIEVSPPEDERPPGVAPVGEEQFRCYPSRADAVAYYTRWYGRRLFVGWLLALAAAIATRVALHQWDRGGAEIGAQGVREVAWAGVGGLVAVILVGFVAAGLAQAFGRGARMTGFILLAPPLLAIGVLLTSGWLGDDWAWVWRATLIATSVLVLPLATIVAAYYGFASPLRRKVGVSILAVATAGLFLADMSTLRAAATSVTVGLLAVALLVLAARALQKRAVALAPRPAVRVASALLVVAGYHAPLAAALARYDDAWALKVAVACELALVTLIASVLALFVLAGARGALFFMARGRVDPDDAATVLRAEGIDDALAPELRAGRNSLRARSIVGFLTSPSRFRRWARTGMAEIGNADTPPMFKNFVRAELTDGGQCLELTCFGVTGWAVHEAEPTIPREDCVRIPLD